MRTFFDLLPYRLDQAIAGRMLHVRRVRRQRKKIAPVMAAGSLPLQRRCRLYIDLAVISRNDAGTGIQRVVRALALALIENASAQWEVCFVTAFRRSAYHAISWPVPDTSRDTRGELITAQPGDVFLGLDFSLDAVRRHRRQLRRFRKEGGRAWFLVFDLLPMQRPEWFATNNVIRYRAWLQVIAGMANGFFCISDQTKGELISILSEHFGLSSGYETQVIPMGHDIRQSQIVPSSGDRAGGVRASRWDMAMPFTLMVGTLEPRKGHGDVLAAYSVLWQQGSDHHLIIVGRMGWRVEELRTHIVEHPQFGAKLLWFDDVGDGELEDFYRKCQGVIVASYAEGFGLPLIEALGHHKPVLARDLPIFRQHQDFGVRYFPERAVPKELSLYIEDWIQAINLDQIFVTQPPNTGWQEASKIIFSTLEENE